MLRLRLLATTALTLLAASALVVPAATAQTATSDPSRPIESHAGDVNALWGDIDAFWGDIDAFEGDVNPFWGDIDAFWGDIDAFWGDIDAFSGPNSPLWGDIDAFWGDIDAFGDGVAPLWGDIDAFWGDIDAFAPPDDPARLGLQDSFNLLVERSEAVWGDSVTAGTGKSFWDGFAADVFAKYGIDINDPSTFDGFSGVDRTRFFFDWYDGLMQYSGRDQADWWMKSTNWTPGLSRSAQSGAGTTIGLLDFTFNSSELVDNTTSWGSRGYDNPMQGHGEAVASLLVSPHDGHGVMGLAPDAKVATFNPFDSTGTASWNDIARGLNTVNLQGARVVNLSLGVPGYTLHPEWNALYTRWDVSLLRHNTVFVHAAGNDGVAQTQDIAWSFINDPAMLVVGSVGPSGEISSFSNTPGSACLLNNGVCSQPNMLMNRFIVAPGEWILVSDGQGGVTRRSGTSFAAPQVTGAIALLQSRWSWLKNKPRETADIILLTARDLGAPGTDAVYGRGLLDIAGSQAPLDYSQLYQTSTNSKGEVVKTYVALASTADDTLFAAATGDITVFEDIGTTYRDFTLPLSAILQASKSKSSLQKTISSTTTTVTSSSKTKFGFASGQIGNPFGWELNLTLAERPLVERNVSKKLPFASDFSVTSKTGVTLSFGDGLGAQSLSGRSDLATDRFDPQSGGVNPVLGLASGGQFANVEVPAFGTARIAIGATSRVADEMFVDPITGEEHRVNEGVAAYQASAAQVLLTQPVGDNLTLRAGYTFLEETDGVLGVQSTNPEAFASGAETDAASLGLSWALSNRLTVSGSATVGRAREQSADRQMLTVGGNGIVTSAFEAALDVDGVFGRKDRARIALVQPMYVEQGGLNLTSLEVIDRDSGELGSVTRYNSVDGQARKFALDVSYSTPVFGGAGELSGFVRGETAASRGAAADFENLMGGRLTIQF